jgi:hypothetical protein
VSEAGLSHIPVSGVVFFSVSSSARTILDWEGFVSTPQGTRPIPPEVWQTALGWARLSAASVTGQLEILAGAENRESPRWNRAQADALFALAQYETAANHYQKAPQTPEIFARLEICYRELGDFKRAYEYACKQR